jgi:hypothetical protein
VFIWVDTSPQHIPSQRLGLWKPSAACYRKLNVSTLSA